MWTRADDKLLELLHFRYFPRWEVIASRLLRRTPEQASQRYERVVDEVTRVLEGLEVDTPREWDTQIVVAAPPAKREAAAVPTAAAADVMTMVSSVGEEAPAAAAVPEKALVPTSEDAAAKKTTRGGKRKKPEKWTEEEHNLFLEGLEKYGKGKWKEMSMEYLTTKSATQIASHHQKHSKRLEQRKRNGCKRASIHDITAPTRAGGGEPAAAQKDERATATDEGGEGELVGAVEDEFPGEDDLGTLFI